MAHWFDDESFWETFAPVMFSNERLAATREEVDSVLRLTNLTQGSVLDLCCGPGRHSVELSSRGFSVIGVDKSAYLLKQARDKSRGANLNVEFIHADMKDFSRDKSFDLVISMFTSFGYFDDVNEESLVLRNIYKSLKPGGKVLIDVMGKECIAKIFNPTRATHLEDGSWVIQTSEILQDWTRLKSKWILVKQGKVVEHEFSHFVFSAKEITDLLIKEGFSGVKVYGGFDGRPYDSNAQRLTVVATK